jgi:hypothetical protein
MFVFCEVSQIYTNRCHIISDCALPSSKFLCMLVSLMENISPHVLLWSLFSDFVKQCCVTEFKSQYYNARKEV